MADTEPQSKIRESVKESDLDAILERLSPERRASFLRARLRLGKFNENDEILAIAAYLDTTVVLINEITRNIGDIQRGSSETLVGL